MFPQHSPADILRGASPGQALAQRLARLEARDRPAPAARPPLGALLGGFSLARVAGLGRAWPESPPRLGLEFVLARMQRVLNGLAAAGSPLAFLLRGQARQLRVYLGCAAEHEALAQTLLAAHFPGARLASAAAETAAAGLDDLPHCHLLAGIPSAPFPPDGEAEAGALEQVDQLARGLIYGADWALAVLAAPLPFADGETLVDQWSAAIEQARLEFQQPGTPGELNRLGALLVDLLEAQLARALAGRTGGNWLAQAYVLGATPAAAPAAAGVFAGPASRPEPLRAIPCSPQARWGWTPAQTVWLNSGDLAVLAQLPLSEYPGYAVSDAARFDVALPEPAPAAGLNLGWVQDVSLPTGQAFLLERDALAGHALIAGATDSGKTNTTFHLLAELAAQGVPFLVIEPAKGEYRFLRASFPDLRLLTLGSPEAPLQINPFYVPPGVRVQTHLDYLLSLFAASFVLYAPMPFVLEAALHEVYLDKGWDLAANRCRRDPAPSERAYPTLSDLYEKVEAITDRLGYEARITLDVKAGLRARLNSLRLGSKGAMLDTRAPLDMGELLRGQVVIEMGAIGDDEQKAFLIGLLLVRLYERHAAAGVQAGRVSLRHVTVIEEAHRLLQNAPQAQGGDFANPRGKAVETFANLIAEMRGYGEGFVVVEQSPVKLAPDVLKNTNVKLAHRVVSADDREALARAMNLDEPGRRALVGLPRGHAVLFAAGMDRPMRVRFAEAKERLAGPAPGPAPGPADRDPAPEGGPGGEVDDPRVRREFARWALTAAAANGPEAAAEARAEAQAALRAAAPLALRDPEMERLLLAAAVPRLADRLAARLGAFYSWPFADEAGLAQALQALWAGGRNAQARALIEQGTAVAVRPFDGCEFCPAPCRYRLFAAQALDADEGARDEGTRVLARCAENPTDAALGQAALYARYLGEKIVHPEIPDAAGAALCATILLGRRLGWHGPELAELAEGVWRRLQP